MHRLHLLAARIIVTEDHVIHTAGSFFMIHYVASGKIMNRGTEASNHIVLGISIRDVPSRAGNVLYQTTTTPIPDILRPGEIADFSLAFSTDDLASYGGLPL